MPSYLRATQTSVTRHDAAIGQLYAAATGQSSWADALDAICAALGFDTATFYVHDRSAVVFDPARPTVQYGMWHRLDPANEPEYRNHYFRVDPRVSYTLAHPGTRLLYDHLYCSTGELNDSEYRAWYRRSTHMEYSMGGHVGVHQPFFGSIALHRRRKLGPSTRNEHRSFTTLFNHLERALNVEYRLHEGRQGLTALHSLADQNANAVVFLDGAGRILHANQRALAYAARNDGFTLGRTMLARRNATQPVLQAAIDDALAGRGSAPIRLPRIDGERDYVAVTTPVQLDARPGLFAHATVAACVIVTDAAERAWSEAALQAAFGLTGAEARLLARLSSGKSLAQISAENRTSVNTLRTQMATVFRKTGVHRQADLVRLVHALPPDSPGTGPGPGVTSN